MNASQEELEILEKMREFERLQNKENMSKEELEVANKTRQYMMDSSKKTKPPKRLFHATRKENRASIEEFGLKAHAMFGQVYFCETEKDCRMFVGNDDAIIIEVDPKKLLPKRFRISEDHSKAHFPCEAYAYYADVPVEAIKNIK